MPYWKSSEQLGLDSRKFESKPINRESTSLTVDEADCLQKVALRAFEQHEYFKRMRSEVVVPNSIPILYFGNLPKYVTPGKKVVTVGLNPSNKEFLCNDRKKSSNGPNSYSALCRFGERTFRKPKDEVSSNKYQDALNRYFENEPYMNWFKKLDPLLEGFHCSFGGKFLPRKYTALHTDIASTTATFPTYSRLRNDVKRELFNEGFTLWTDLIEKCLKPDYILLSGNDVIRKELQKKYGVLGLDDSVGRIQFGPRKTVLYSEKFIYEKNVVFVYGTNSRSGPFGNLKDTKKREIGRILSESE